MGIEQEFRNRQWPESARKKGYATGDYGAWAVSEGRVLTRALSMHQDLSEEIPAGESNITSLARAADSRVVFGATSGRHSHLFSYDPGPNSDSVTDYGIIEGAIAVRRSLVVHDGDRVFGGVSATEEEGGTGQLFGLKARSRGEAAGPPQNMDGTHPAPVEFIGAPLEGECIAALAINSRANQVYGLTSVTGTFFVYDIEADTFCLKGVVASDGKFSSLLIVGPEGCVYGSGSCGEIFRYDPQADGLSSLGLHIGSIKGRQFYNAWDSAALDPVTGLIYCGGSADGILSVFDPEEQTVRSLGKPAVGPRIRAMAMGLDGRLYGIGGDLDGMGRLFRYDTQTHELADLGILRSSEQRMWNGYEFDAAVTGLWGEIYFGESDRISHLFIYQPPIQPRKAGTCCCCSSQ